MRTTEIHITARRWLVVYLGVLGLVTCFTSACGSKSSKGSPSEKNQPRSSGDVLRSLDCSSAAGAAAGNEATLTLTVADAPELRKVPAEDLVVQEGKSVVSLCDILRANSEAKLGLFMFTSASCYKCQQWIATVAGGISGQGNAVLPVVIMAESPVVISDADMDELKEQVASDAIWVRDPGLDVWKFFSASDDAQARVVPTILEMDTATRGFLVEDTALEAKDLIERANSALGLGLGSGA